MNIRDQIANIPCLIVTSQYSWSSNMEKILRSQIFRENKMSKYMSSKKTLEINPTNSIIKALKIRLIFFAIFLNTYLK